LAGNFTFYYLGNRQCNCIEKDKRTQTMIYKALYKTLKMEQHESHKYGVNSCPPKGFVVRPLYWIHKSHKCPLKQRYIAGSTKCSTIPLSKLLTCIISVVKTGIQSYCDTSYPRGGVNQMWFWRTLKIC
jgi:hypothetical protein